MIDYHPHLDLARDLICNFVEIENYDNATENAQLMTRLEAGGEDVFKPLPGNTLAEIYDNLNIVFYMASCPVPLPTSGRNREGRQWASQRQRERIKLHARVCLALLGTGPQSNPLPGAI